MKEHALQVAVAHMLQVVLDPEKTWFSAIDHAAKLSVRVNRKTGARYSPQGQSRQQRGVKKGLPDFILMAEFPLPHMHRTIGIELKTDKGKLSPPQMEVAKAWSKLGHSIYVARSLEEVQEILEFCHVPMRSRMKFFPSAQAVAWGQKEAKKLAGKPHQKTRPLADFIRELRADHERAQRAAPPRHPRARRQRKSKTAVPVVLRRSA